MTNNKQNHNVEVNNMVSSIDKEFVPYKEALALKELGFNEPCFGFYNSFGFNINTHIKNSDDLISIEFERIKYHLCTTPTFSQAFRWFRENYNLHANISSWRDDADLSFYHEFEIYSLESAHSTGNVYFTYEEAELECLKKLIKIVKEKNNEQQ